MSELEDVQEAVNAMMVSRGLEFLENPIGIPTNNMKFFPDIDHPIYDDYFGLELTENNYIADAEGNVIKAE